MPQRVLITGGAGFIGSHLVDELLNHNYHVRVLDSLCEQVHSNGDVPVYLNPEAELIVGDVRNAEVVGDALANVDAVVHLAAAVGVGQSMYEIARYTSVNNMGTAVLLEALAKRPVEKLVVASSMSIYGEGSYQDARGHKHEVLQRRPAQLRAGEWDIPSGNGRPLDPIPTPESKRPDVTSVYALSKYDQERLCLSVGQAYGINTTALRLFNVFGPRQALSNPYTGVMAIFASRYMNGLPPLIYEDGQQRRDFVAVRDVARAFRLALESRVAGGAAINIGSGRSVTISQVAREMAKALGSSRIEPEITGKYRVGDIRHCFADITLAQELLDYDPETSFEDGLTELVQWLDGQAAGNGVDSANDELRVRGLLV